MKKQKFLKSVALVGTPDLLNAITPPVTHNDQVSVVFKESDISIHGWDGSTWTQIYTKVQDDVQFKFANTYQKYYIKSNTNAPQSVYVSFFSSDDIASSKPQLAGLTRETRLYDIEQVPIYRVDDAEKLLTILSDGKLAWLGANESYVVETETVDIGIGGSGGGTGGSGTGGDTGTGGSGEPPAPQPTEKNLFTITEVLDVDGAAITGGRTGDSLLVTIKGEILVAGIDIKIDGTSVTHNENGTWEYSETISSTKTFSFKAVDPTDSTYIEEEKATVSLIADNLSNVLAPQTQTPDVDPQSPPATYVDADGNIVVTNSHYIIDEEKAPGLFPTGDDKFTMTISIKIEPSSPSIFNLFRFGTTAIGNSTIRLNKDEKKVELMNAAFQSVYGKNSNPITLIDLQATDINFNDGVERRFTFVFDRSWSVTGTAWNSGNAASKYGSWRVYGFFGEAGEGKTIYGSDKYHYAPKGTTFIGDLLANQVVVGFSDTTAKTSFTLKEFGVLRGIDLTKEQIEYSIINNSDLITTFSNVQAERTTVPVSEGNLITLPSDSTTNITDFGTPFAFDYGFQLDGTNAKLFPRGLRYSIHESYARHNPGKTIALGVSLGFDFPVDQWSVVASNFSQGSANNIWKGWGLFAKKDSVNKVKFVLSYASSHATAFQTIVETVISNPTSNSLLKTLNPTQTIVSDDFDLGDGNFSILLKHAPSTTYRGESNFDVFINDFASPAISVIYANLNYGTHFGAYQDGALWDTVNTGVWDYGIASTDQANCLILGGAKISTGSDPVQNSNTTGNKRGFVGVFSFLKMFYGLTDATMDSQLYEEMQETFGLTNIPQIIIETPENNSLLGDDIITVSGTAINVETLTYQVRFPQFNKVLQSGTLTIDQANKWTFDAVNLSKDTRTWYGGSNTGTGDYGPSSFANVPYRSKFERGNKPFTIQTWYKMEAAIGGYIMCKLGADSRIRWGFDKLNGLTRMYYREYNLASSNAGDPGNIDKAVYRNFEPQLDQWYHLAVVNEPGMPVRTYINGVEVIHNSTILSTSYNIGKTSNLQLGHGGRYVTGFKWDERAYSGQEILEIFNQGVSEYGIDGLQNDKFTTSVQTGQLLNGAHEIIMHGVSDSALETTETLSFNVDYRTPVLSMIHEDQEILNGDTITLVAGETIPKPTTRYDGDVITADIEITPVIGQTSTVVYVAQAANGRTSQPFTVNYEFVAWEVQHLEEQATLGSGSKIDAVGNLYTTTTQSSLKQTATRQYSTRQTLYLWANLKQAYVQTPIVTSNGTRIQLGNASDLKTSIWTPSGAWFTVWNDVVGTTDRISYNQVNKWFNVIASWVDEVDSNGNQMKEMRLWIDGKRINIGPVGATSTLYATETISGLVDIKIGSTPWLLDGLTITNDFIDDETALQRFELYKPVTLRLASDQSYISDIPYALQNSDFNSKYTLWDVDNTPVTIDVDESIIGYFDYDIGDENDHTLSGLICEQPETQHLEELGDLTLAYKSENVLAIPSNTTSKYTWLNTLENSEGNFPLAGDFLDQAKGFPGQTISFWIRVPGGTQAYSHANVRILENYDESGNLFTGVDALNINMQIGAIGSITYSHEYMFSFKPIGATKSAPAYPIYLGRISQEQDWKHFIFTYDATTGNVTCFVDGVSHRIWTGVWNGTTYSYNVGLMQEYNRTTPKTLRIGRPSSSGTSWGGAFLLDGVTYLPYHIKPEMVQNLKDSYAPTTDITVECETNFQIKSDTYLLKGITKTGYKVYVNNTHVATADSKGEWSTTLNLVLGDVNKFTISSSNVDGSIQSNNTIQLSILSQDFISPVITLIDKATNTDIGSYASLLQNSLFEDQFELICIDNMDGDLTSQIVITPAIDTSVVGTTTYTVTATDNAGNQGIFTFDLKVSDGQHENGIEDFISTTLNGAAQLTNGVLTLTAQGDYAESNSNHHNSATEQTISTWINASQLGTVSNLTSDTNWSTGGHTVLTTRDYAALNRANGFTLHVSSNAIRYSGPHSSNTTSAVSAEIATNKWYKLDVVWGSNYQKLYINGSLVHSATTSGTIAGGANNLYIGRNVKGNDMQFFGQIDGVSVENVAKTAEQIYQSYLEGLWRESSTPTTIVDSTAQTFVRANGDFINLGDNVDYDRSYGEDFAVELDVNFTSLSGSEYDIIGKGSSNPWKGWAILVYKPSGVPKFRMWANTNATVNASLGMDSPTPIVVDQWYTIKAVWRSSGAQELWVDGAKVAERTMGLTYMPPIDSTYHLKIGGAFTDIAGRTFDGQIRNVNFYKGTV